MVRKKWRGKDDEKFVRKKDVTKLPFMCFISRMKLKKGGQHMEQKEWKAIYEMYYKPLYLYALSLTANQQDAEDLLQETFVKAFLSYKDTGSIKYWLITVLKHEFLNLQRKRKKELLDNGEVVLDSKVFTGENVLEKIIANEERQLLFAAIQELPLQMKEILMESVYFHMKDAEIARIHNLTEVNVRKIRSRAKSKLLEYLSK